MMRRLEAFLLILVMLLVLTSCTANNGAVNVTASKVKSDNTLDGSSYSACLQAVTEVTVVPKVTATITGVKFKVGDHVNQGDVLITLDRSDIQNQFNQAKATYDIAKTNYENTQKGTAASTRLKLQQAVDTAQIGEESATIAFNTAQSSYDKVNFQVAIGEASSYDLQQAESALKNAQCALDTANTNLKSAQDTLKLNDSTLIPESITVAAKQVDSAKASLATAQSSLDNTKIGAPISGVLSVLNATTGEIATAQSTNVTLIDTSSVNLVISVTGSDVLQLQNGISVPVTLNDVAKGYTGTIISVSPSADAKTGLFEVKINIDNSTGELRAGMLATAQFNSETAATPALYVPQQSVLQENGEFYVYKVIGNGVEKTSVELGANKNLYIEIKSGLSADDTVVVDGVDKLNETSKVNVIKSIE
ncbi:MAG: family efflux transporter, subunit [Evtepia sp.]|jgi:multidrug efflux pump subunit AcrA (membrane-fusion protein)|nr:family efflux transporter, subunit [Evtepia sp.]